MNLSTSDKCIEFLIKKEGMVLKPYKDVGGKLTIGVGHLITDIEKKTGLILGINYKNGINKTQAILIKKHDLERFENCINKYVEVELTQNEFDALISLSFNIGDGAFRNSTLLKKLNNNESKEEVAKQFLSWNKVNGNPLIGLTNRRKDEIEIFLNSNYG